MKHLLLIATGGTIACGQTKEGLTPMLSPEEMLAFVPEAIALARITAISPFSVDSTNISPAHWCALATLIKEHYRDYDGFVICHGTDTLAYTAAALSYLVQGTAKPIVLTGAQRPITEASTDARDNLLDAIRYAAERRSGVVIVFDHQVIAGTRARKTRTRSYIAFSSINFPELAVIHGSRIISYLPEPQTDAPIFYDTLCADVSVLKLVPGLSEAAFLALGRAVKGLIIESYGVGGIPDVYLPALDTLLAEGKTVIMATQVPREGSDIAIYRVGNALKRRYRLLETYDMTPETTVTKLMWAMGQSDDPTAIRKAFITPINFDLLF